MIIDMLCFAICKVVPALPKLYKFCTGLIMVL